MNPAQAQIVKVLRDQQPDGGWTASKLRVATGLDKAAFQDALRALRNTGKVAFAGFDLSPSMLEQAASVDADAVASVAASVKAEAQAMGANRKAARTIGANGARGGMVDASVTGLSIGGQLQHAALGDDQVAAVQLARSQWGELWDRLCDSAVSAGERPVQAMRRLIEAGLWVERLDQEEASA